VLSQDLLTRHTAPVAQFLNSNYERFFDGYTELLQSENYVTRRQSLKVRTAASRLQQRGQPMQMLGSDSRSNLLRMLCWRCCFLSSKGGCCGWMYGDHAGTAIESYRN
jgi:hypothetical protein